MKKALIMNLSIIKNAIFVHSNLDELEDIKN
jgi:hypothetical protein